MENNAVFGFLLKIYLKFFYFFFKLLPQKPRVVFISREQNTSPIDFVLLEKEIKKTYNIETVTLCKTIDKSVVSLIVYCLYLLKCCFYLATSKVCIVDTYCIPVSVLNHKKGLYIIQIWHALGALKKFGYQSLGKNAGRDIKTAKRMRMHENYDLVCAPSNATAVFYKQAFNVSDEQIGVFGMPRIDDILAPQPNLKTEFLNKYPAFSGKKIILYVPTFRDGKKVKYKELANSLTEKWALIVKPHILSESDVETEFLTEGFSTNELLKIADVIVTDYSAVSFEASLLEKPLYFYLYDFDEYSEDRGLNINLFEEMSDAVFQNAVSLMDAIINENYNFDQLKTFKNKYIETANTENSKKLAKKISENFKKN